MDDDRKYDVVNIVKTFIDKIDDGELKKRLVGYFNKYKETYEQSAKAISLELKKRDSQNKILVREDSTVDLFSEKSLDNETITPATLTDISYKVS